MSEQRELMVVERPPGRRAPMGYGGATPGNR
jgi:hypothetical protein